MRIKGKHDSGEVWVDGRPLDPADSQAVWNHSPTGFAWGYSGSGPAQLALALLLATGCVPEVAVARHQNLKGAVVAGLKGDFDVEIDVRPDGTWGEPVDRSPRPVAEEECPNCRNGTVGLEGGRLVCRGECGNDFGKA